MTVTVVVPVHGKSALTHNCLDVLLRSSLPDGVRVLVVDDASPDDTADVLASYGDRIDVLRMPRNVGFGAACNAGVAHVQTDLVVLLNNDTTPHDGWLDALLRYADAHPAAAAIGARLLHLDGTVQHAGVVFGRDGLPHHVYAGFPGDAPAVLRSRPFQVVTGACLLLRRDVFLGLGGFDLGYRNGHEDVDLCLRLGQAGHEVHYCADAVLTHLESVSRGRRSADDVANAQRYCATWQARVRPDDLETYAEDGLLAVRYEGDATPLSVEVAPALATVRTDEGELERLLRHRTLQVHELLQDAVRLSVLAADAALLAAQPPRAQVPATALSLASLAAPTHERLLAHDDRVQTALAELQEAVAARLGDAYAPHPGPAYRALVHRVRTRVARAVPADAHVLVVSRGDDDLLAVPGVRTGHFPAHPDGRWAGFHPADSDAALAALADAQADGATHLVLPASALWWLDHYPGLATALTAQPPVVAHEDCVVYALGSAA
jgi:GT2 family glycosyltransferase